MSNLSSKTFLMPSVQEIDHLIKFCEVLAKAPFYAKMGPGGVLAIYLTAREMNLPFMMCLNGGLYTFDGKVTMSAQLMNMLIVNNGHRADVLQLDENGCKIRFVRSDRRNGEGNTFEYEFTLEMAKNAGYLSKPNWRAHPRDMMYSRCLSGGARKFMPDILLNAYVHGELDDDKSIDTILPDIETLNDQLLILQPKIDHQEEIIKLANFCIDQQISEGTKKMTYVNHVAEKGQCSVDDVIKSAMKNTARFETGFSKWQSEEEKI